jgi:hypothetical protein
MPTAMQLLDRPAPRKHATERCLDQVGQGAILATRRPDVGPRNK